MIRVSQAPLVATASALLTIVVAGCSPSTTTAPEQPPTTAAAAVPENAPVYPAEPRPHPSAVAVCLQERGWDAQVSVRGDAVLATIPDDQMREYGADNAWCAAALGVPIGPATPRALESTDLDAWQEVGACLTSLGIPTDPLPEDTEQVLRSWANGSPTWNPYYAAGREGHLTHAVETCPPPSE